MGSGLIFKCFAFIVTEGASFFFGMVCVHGITWVSKFFVTQSRFAKGSKGFKSVVK